MKKFLSFMILAIFISSCQTYESEFTDKFKQRGKTEDEAYVAYYMSFRSWFSEEVDSNGKKVFVPKYGILRLSDLEEKLESSLSIIDEVNDYKNELNAAFVDEFNLREELEKDRKVIESRFYRVRVARLHEEFRAKSGVSFHGMASENGKYDARRIFWPKDLESAFPFTFEKIDDAKNRKILKEIEHETWSSKRMFDRKKLDPENLNDPNAFVWESKEEALELTSFKILDVEKPDNNQSDYIEAFRVLDGKKERKPALKIFFPQTGARGVMVMDVDKEKEVGFGIPDVVEDVFISKIEDIWSNGTIIPRLFMEKGKRLVSQKPEEKPINVEIARIGEPVDTWEVSKDSNGWTTPFNFKNDIGDNYNVKLKLEDVQSEMILNRKIEYIAKEWTGGNRFTPSVGAVVEYFKPKSPYNGDNISKAEVKHLENTKMISFVFENGTIENGIVTHVSNKFIEDEPYSVEYTEGQKRWRLEKDEGSKIFNKRKEVAMPKQATGNY